MIGLPKREGPAHDHGLLAVSGQADAATFALGGDFGGRRDGRARRSGRAQDMRIGTGGDDQIPGFEGLDRSMVEDHLAASLRYDMDAAKTRLAERYRPGRTQFELAIAGGSKVQLAHDGGEHIHGSPHAKTIDEAI